MASTTAEADAGASVSDWPSKALPAALRNIPKMPSSASGSGQEIIEASDESYDRSFLLRAKYAVNGSTASCLEQQGNDLQAREGSEADISSRKFKFTRPLFSSPESVVWLCNVEGPTATTAGDGSDGAKPEAKKKSSKMPKGEKKTTKESKQKEATTEALISDDVVRIAASSDKKAAKRSGAAGATEHVTQRAVQLSSGALPPNKTAQRSEPTPVKLALSNHVDSAERTPKSGGDTPGPDMSGSRSLHSPMGMGIPDPAAMMAAMAMAHHSAYLQTMTMGFGAMLPTPNPGQNGLTTVMLRNIPNRYTREMLVDQLNQKFKGRYDFLYLPIDFNSKCNVGYAFINFRTPQACQRFFQDYNGRRAKAILPGFSSMKVCEVSYARVQGRDANMDNLCDDKFIEKLIEHPDWQPLFFDDQGREIPFSKTVKESKQRRQQASNQQRSSAPSAMPFPGMAHPMAMYGNPMHAAMSNMMYPSSPANKPSKNRQTPTTGSISACVFLPSLLPHASADTVVMLRSVPSRLSQYEFVEELNKRFYGHFDCTFVPGNAKGDGNRRFAFINFRSQREAQMFVDWINESENTKAVSSELRSCEACKSQETFLFFEDSLRILWQNMAKGRVEASQDWQPLLFTVDSTPWHPSLMEYWGTFGSMPSAMPNYPGVPSIANEASVAAQAAEFAKQYAQRAMGCPQVDAGMDAMSQQQAYMHGYSQDDSYMGDEAYEAHMYYSGMQGAMPMDDYSSWYADGSSWDPQFAGAMA